MVTKKTKVAILISDKIEFKIKMIKKETKKVIMNDKGVNPSRKT